MRKILMAAGLLGLIVAFTDNSSAQEFDKDLFKLMRPAMNILRKTPASYLTNKSVQEELKLDEEQKKAIAEKTKGLIPSFGKGGGDFNKTLEKFKDLKDVPEDQLEGKMREILKPQLDATMTDLNKTLKPEQAKRLAQISRQQGGLAAMLDADNAKELKLEDEQVKKITTISKELDKDVAELLRTAGKGGKGGFGPSAETREKMTNLRKDATEKVNELLSKDQKSKWKELTGEPFEMKFDFGGPRPTPKKE